MLQGYLHLGYAFSKQDFCKLPKIGLSFINAESECNAYSAVSVPGNKIPNQVECTGTRRCVGGDKITQSVAQATASPMKRLSKTVPGEMSCGLRSTPRTPRKGPIAEWGAPMPTYAAGHRVDNLPFGISIEQSFTKLIRALPVGCGLCFVGGDSVVLFTIRATPQTGSRFRMDFTQFAAKKPEPEKMAKMELIKASVEDLLASGKTSCTQRRGQTSLLLLKPCSGLQLVRMSFRPGRRRGAQMRSGRCTAGRR